MTVYAYGVMQTMYRDSWLHYWIDAGLQYGQEVRSTPELPDGLAWAQNKKHTVELSGPGEFTISWNP